jgi:H+/Cl- antiporter ClcA
LKWLALAMITGVPCGIIGAAFDLAVEHVTELRTEHTAILFLLPVIGLVIVALAQFILRVVLNKADTLQKSSSGYMRVLPDVKNS